MHIKELTFTHRDEYRRTKVAEGIKAVLASEHLNISRLLINGEWGEGRTEFCHKLLNSLGHDHYHLIYVDAFASDNVDNPLLTITAEIAKLLPQGKLRSRFISKVKPALKVGMKITGKAAISWITKQNADSINNEFEKELQQEAERLSDLFIENSLKEQIEAEESINSLKNALDILTRGENGKPIIICIDELDRCRPPYSISMLETVKHVFNTKYVQFIFSANKTTLEQSIKHHYGVKDSQRYLDKFIDFSLELPRSELSLPGMPFEFKMASISHLKSELNRYQLTQVSNLFTPIQNKPTFILEALNNVPTLTLRDAEKLALNIAVLNQIADITWNQDVDSCLIILGIYAYTFYRTEFKELEKSEYSLETLLMHFFGYTSKGVWINGTTFKEKIFTILISSIKTHPEDKFSASQAELEQKIRQLSNEHYLNDIYDLKTYAQIFINTYRQMINLTV